MVGCNLKINLSSDSNKNNDQIEPAEIENTDQLASGSNMNLSQSSPDENSDFSIEQTEEGLITRINKKKNNEVWIEEPLKLCETEVMFFAQPELTLLILTPFNPGSDKPVSSLYSLDLAERICSKMEISKELSDFGARVLSPDNTKLAVALETNEARALKVLDLILDESNILLTLDEGETLNGGYGALSNHFGLSWVDNSRIQYTVYNDTIKNYDIDAPETLEKVKEMRIANIK